MKPIKKIIWKILNLVHIGGSIQFLLNGALIEDGWFKSFHSKKSVDAKGNPLPWCTYSFIKFIEPRLKKQLDVFEFGCGNSTLWYAQRISSIKAVEHNQNWFLQMKKNLPKNVNLVFQQLKEDGDYAKEILQEQKSYHLIIIDGEDRNNCVKHSLQKLTQDGVIIYDNSYREEYADSFRLLQEKGFKRIDFHGLAPIINYNSCTSVFYREKNCLKI